MERLNVATLADAARWHLVFMLLSMEKTGRFWPDLGLAVAPPEVFGEIARAFVRKFREVENDPSISADERLSEYHKLLRDAFVQIAHAHGEEVAAAILEWGSHVFQYGTDLDAQAFVWRRLLRRLAGVSDPAYPLVPLTLQAQKLEKVNVAIRKHLGDPREFRRRLSAAKQEPLSPWEELLYAAYTPGASPMDWVENTVEFVKTRSAWSEMERSLNREELETLRKWGEKQAAAMEMPANLVTLPRFTGTE